MEKQTEISGVRLGRDYVRICQITHHLTDRPPEPLYLTMGTHHINMVFMTLNSRGGRSFITGAVAAGQPFSYPGSYPAEGNGQSRFESVSMISIFPHRYRYRVLASVLKAIGAHALPILAMTSSNALLTFMVRQEDGSVCVDQLCGIFNLPASRVMIEQPEDKQMVSQFLKQRYPQTRASYIEDKIKTYGIDLIPDLVLTRFESTPKQLLKIAERMESNQNSEQPFFYVSADRGMDNRISFCMVTSTPLYSTGYKNAVVDLLHFHGPHFGDRHSIAARALNHLKEKQIHVCHAGCTGAAITLLIPGTRGMSAKQALSRIFEIPERQGDGGNERTG